MSYFEALRHYNDQSNEWCSPKKGTAEYDKVREIMNSNRVPLPRKDKPIRKARMKSSGTGTSMVSVSTQAGAGYMKAGRPKKPVKPVLPNPITPIAPVPVPPKKKK